MFEFLTKALKWCVKQFGLPPFHDGEALQEWLLDFLGMAKGLTALIPGDWDDNFAKLATKVIGDEEAWAAIHEWLLVEFGGLPRGGKDRIDLEGLAGEVAKGLEIDLDDVLDFLRWLIDIIELLFGK